MSDKAGLTLPVARVRRYLKAGKYAARVTPTSAVFCTAVLDYMVAELLELAGNCARDHQKKRITPHHVMLAIRNDNELDKLLCNAIILGGGVKSHIHPELLQKKPARSSSTMAV
ncbi:unnamed protein product [Mycena citricolor]|uniref:Histone H2A n=1 Tax=Mycena citricolor TaxID=2018698 RepID=A0AAD2JZE9_9AGAR|nr:unnamed protein product [Mycena citricolor]